MNEFLIGLKEAVLAAEKDGPLWTSDLLTGYSGEKLVGFLQRSVKLLDGDASLYLEVGVFQGLTLLSTAAAVPGVRAVGIDDFSQFDPQRINRTTFESRRSGLGLKNVTLVNADYEDALEALHGTIGERKVGVYFVDGPHDYRSQLMCLLLAKPYLSEHAVIVVDDCNYEHVRQANSDFLRTNPEFRLFFEAYTPAHPNNMTDSQLECARRGWWNGVNVIVRDPEGLLEPICPDTPRGRDLFLATHEVQSHRGAYGVMHALRLADSLMRGRVIKAVRSAFGFARSIRRNRYQEFGAFESLNTNSDKLTTGALNPALADSC